MKQANYELLIEQAEALLGSETSALANAANLSALIYSQLPRVNWAGFYFRQHDELTLGPFQGQLACTRIPVGAGVCGTAVSSKLTQRIADVHAFDGHIACDSASRSELVVPLQHRNDVIGVLDIDSPELDRFHAPEQSLIESLAAIWQRCSDLQTNRLFVTQ